MGTFQKNQRPGRLIHVHGFRRNSNYEYDLNSNRIHGHAGDSEFNAVYDNQDRLIRFNQSVFSYNPNGELLSKSERIKCDKDDDKKNKNPSYINTAFQYDVFGNLRQAGKVSYQIDPLQRRSTRLVNGVVTNRYIYNPEGQLIGELDASGTLIKTFVYATKSHVPDYFVDSNNERFKLIVDQLGSVRLVVKASTGEIVQKMNHDEFGKVLIDSKPMYQPFGYAGGIYDSETKLVLFKARSYNSETGRWTSKDPIRFSGGDSNLYGYVLQDPVNGIDPSGLDGQLYTTFPFPHAVVGITDPNSRTGTTFVDFGPSSGFGIISTTPGRVSIGDSYPFPLIPIPGGHYGGTSGQDQRAIDIARAIRLLPNGQYPYTPLPILTGALSGNAGNNCVDFANTVTSPYQGGK